MNKTTKIFSGTLIGGILFLLLFLLFDSLNYKILSYIVLIGAGICLMIMRYIW